jgi:transposase InsO family protein
VDHPGQLVQLDSSPSAGWQDLAARGWRLERVMSDNASEFRSATFQQTITKLGARHTFIRAGRPQTNGCVERVQQTILDEVLGKAKLWHKRR